MDVLYLTDSKLVKSIGKALPFIVSLSFWQQIVKYLIKFEILTLTLAFLILIFFSNNVIINNKLDPFQLDFII